jgi:hypothetical protein
MQKSRLIDDRMGGEPLYYFSQPKGILMRISDQVKKCVGFVGLREGLEIKWGGTAFFVNISEDGLLFYYMVTAKHVAEALDGSDCVIRVNNKQGRAMLLEASTIKWWYHPTEKAIVDSAVTPFANPTRELDVATISHTLFATPDVIQEYEIGIGDEVYVAGLFSKITRTAKIQPVLRTGTIAMMPDEKIEFSEIGLIDAYLIETKSFGGLSGCPVFARHTVSTPLAAEPNGPPIGKFKRLYGGGSSYLLGSMIGHYIVPKDFDPTLSEAVNMGLSAVVPIHKILEVVNHPELAAMRKTVIEDERRKREATAVLDTAFTRHDGQKTPKGLDIPVPTEDQFISDLKKASRKKG